MGKVTQQPMSYPPRVANAWMAALRNYKVCMDGSEDRLDRYMHLQVLKFRGRCTYCRSYAAETEPRHTKDLLPFLDIQQYFCIAAHSSQTCIIRVLYRAFHLGEPLFYVLVQYMLVRRYLLVCLRYAVLSMLFFACQWLAGDRSLLS